MKILFVISSTVSGGAEKQLIELLKSSKLNHEVTLLVLAPRGSMSEVYEKLGIPVQHLDTGGSLRILFDLIEIFRLIREFKPRIIQTFLYKADILTTIVAVIASHKKIFWTAGNTQIPNLHYWKKIPLILLSKKHVKGVFANSEQAQEFHVQMGYPKEIFIQVPNFLPPETQKGNRTLDKIKENSEFRIGLAARAVEGKGHLTLLKAITDLNLNGKNLKLSLIGEGIKEWPELKKNIALQGVHDSVELLSRREDLTDWYLNLDLFVLASDLWESFPNVLAEAVSLNVPVISSDVGNIASEIFDIRNTFQAGSDEDLAKRISEFANQSELDVAIECTRLNQHLHSKFKNTHTFEIWEKGWKCR